MQSVFYNELWLQKQKTINNTKILIGVIALLLVGMGVAAYFIFNQKAQIQELQEVSILNKQELEDGYGQLSYEYEKVKITEK